MASPGLPGYTEFISLPPRSTDIGDNTDFNAHKTRAGLAHFIVVPSFTPSRQDGDDRNTIRGHLTLMTLHNFLTLPA